MALRRSRYPNAKRIGDLIDRLAFDIANLGAGADLDSMSGVQEDAESTIGELEELLESMGVI